jgi:glycosyltransferase involved in cell wall biosynthesis
VWLRAFHDIYNPALALQVLSLLLREHPDATLTMVGPDKGDGTLGTTRRLAEKLDLYGRVSFVGAVPKTTIPDILKHADVFLNTTNIDNTPVSVLEAMAAGLCVVSTNVGGIPYVLSNDIDSLLVPPRDPESMTMAVSRILDEPDLAARLSSNARKKAEQYDWALVMPHWEALLTDLASETPSP